MYSRTDHVVHFPSLEGLSVGPTNVPAAASISEPYPIYARSTANREYVLLVGNIYRT